MAKLTDSRLAELAQRHKELKAKEAKFKADAEKIQGKVIKEMTRRGTKAIEHQGSKEIVRVTVVQQESVDIDFEKLKHRLKPNHARKVTKEVLDIAALQQLVQSGKVSPATVAACSEVTPKKPYMLVSIKTPTNKKSKSKRVVEIDN